jgi:hypothetical protein
MDPATVALQAFNLALKVDWGKVINYIDDTVYTDEEKRQVAINMISYAQKYETSTIQAKAEELKAQLEMEMLPYRIGSIAIGGALFFVFLYVALRK